MWLLEIADLGKRFGGLQALGEVALSCAEGAIQGLIGPNGSGKTTCFNVISGIHRADAGRVVFRGEEITRLSPPAINRRGLARTFQDIQLFYDLTVEENALIGGHRLGKAGVWAAILGPRWARDEARLVREKARAALEFVGLFSARRELARNIPYGHQRLLEIARALAGEPALILLDEPAAGMNQAETRELMELIARIRERGVTVLLVEHNMKLVMDICERITVLNHGRVIADGAPREIQAHEQVIEAYLGRGRRAC